MLDSVEAKCLNRLAASIPFSWTGSYVELGHLDTGSVCLGPYFGIQHFSARICAYFTSDQLRLAK